MKNRISKKLVSFRNPFSLDSIEGEWPAGDYTVETEEEPLDSLSFLTYRRVATTMIVRPPKGKPGKTSFLVIDPTELDEALVRDLKPLKRAENNEERTS